MIKESKIFSDNQLRQLIDAYFEGSIQSVQLDSLLKASKAYADGVFITHDRQIAEELQTIFAIENFAQTTLLSLETKIPDDLENRLDTHISQLASRSRKKWIWVKAGSAAACVALLLTAGLHFLNHTPTLSTLRSENKIAIVSAMQPSSNSNDTSALPGSDFTKLSEPTSEFAAVDRADESVLTATTISPTTFTSTSVAANINPQRKLNNSNGKTKVKNARSHGTINLPHPMTEATIPDIACSINIPETLPYIQGIMPTLLAAKAEVADLITSPFAAIGQTFDKVVESLNVVNATMYEANKTAAAVSQEFLEASTAPLRSI